MKEEKQLQHEAKSYPALPFYIYQRLCEKQGREEALACSPVTRVTMREGPFIMCPLSAHSNMPQSGSN